MSFLQFYNCNLMLPLMQLKSHILILLKSNWMIENSSSLQVEIQNTDPLSRKREVRSTINTRPSGPQRRKNKNQKALRIKKIGRASRIARQGRYRANRSSQYEPLGLKRPATTQTSRVDAQGNVEVFICPFCRVEYMNRYSCKNHIKKKCPIAQEHYFKSQQKELERKKLEQIQKLLREEAQGELVIPDPDRPTQGFSRLSVRMDQRMSTLETQIRQIQSQLISFKNIPLQQLQDHERREKAKKLANECLNGDFLTGLKTILHALLVQTILAGINNKIQVEDKIPTLQMAIYAKVRNMQLFEDLDGWRQKLKKFHNQLEELKIKQNCASSTLSRLRKGYNFLMRFSDQEVKYQSLVVADLMIESFYGRTAVVNYYKRLMDSGYEFSMYPPLPKKIQIYRPVSNHLQSISYLDVINQVQALFSNGKQIMACDLWMITCMGYRKRDTLRLRFYSQSSRSFARAISLIQHKNNHRSLRIVPQSLVQLMIESSARYPISQIRLVEVQKYCLEKFHRFYALRSVCITTITKALHQMNRGIGQFHRRASTTSKFYIDDRSGSYIDSAFSLPWLTSTKANFGKIIFDFGKETQPMEKPLDENLGSDITTPVEEIIDLNWHDSVSCASQKDLRQYISKNEDGKKSLELCQIVGRNQVIHGQNQDLQSIWFQNIQQVLSFIIGKNCQSIITFKILQDQRKEGEQNDVLQPSLRLNLDKISICKIMSVFGLSQKQILSLTSLLYNVNLTFYTFTQPKITPQITTFISQINKNSLPIVIVRYNTREGVHYQVSEVQQKQRLTTFLPAIFSIERQISTFKERCNRVSELSNGVQFGEELRKLNMEVQKKAKQKTIKKGGDSGVEFQPQQVQGGFNNSRTKISRGAKSQALDKIKKLTKQVKIIKITAQDPVCTSDICQNRQNILNLQECKLSHRHMFLQCMVCKQKTVHKCSDWSIMEDKFIQRKEIRIIATGQVPGSSEDLLPLKEQPRQNNSKQIIEKRGFKLTDRAVYLSDVPRRFYCDYRTFSEKICKIVNQNRKKQRFLPLTIQESKIKELGLGVFANVDIPPNTLVCSYIGEIGTHESLAKSDSLFTLGWIEKKCIIIGPSTYSNIGRFINSNSGSISNNCLSMIGLLKYQKTEPEQYQQNFEICVLIYTIKLIKAGEELKYPYGDYYPLKNLEPIEEELNQI